MAERVRPTDSLEVRRTTGSNDVLDRLFVYSTLRTGQTARSLITNLVEADLPCRVIGEVLWLTDLPATFGLLDAYEGDDFARVIRQVELDTGEALWTWIYVLADPDAARHGTL